MWYSFKQINLAINLYNFYKTLSKICINYDFSNQGTRGIRATVSCHYRYIASVNLSPGLKQDTIRHTTPYDFLRVHVRCAYPHSLPLAHALLHTFDTIKERTVREFLLKFRMATRKFSGKCVVKFIPKCVSVCVCVKGVEEVGLLRCVSGDREYSISYRFS